MLLTRFDPFADFRDMWRVPEPAAAGVASGVASDGASGTGFTPAMDVRRTDAGTELTFAVAGVTPDDVSVEAHKGVLTIRGERSERSDATTGTWVRRDIRYGSFIRRFRLGADVDPATISARVEHGMLHVTIPKPAAEAPVTIDVAGDSATAQAPVPPTDAPAEAGGDDTPSA